MTKLPTTYRSQGYIRSLAVVAFARSLIVTAHDEKLMDEVKGTGAIQEIGVSYKDEKRLERRLEELSTKGMELLSKTSEGYSDALKAKTTKLFLAFVEATKEGKLQLHLLALYTLYYYFNEYVKKDKDGNPLTHEDFAYFSDPKKMYFVNDTIAKYVSEDDLANMEKSAWKICESL